MHTVALVPAAGRGERLGSTLPKALVPVAGTPLLTHAVRGLLDCSRVDQVIVAAPPGHLDTVGELVAGRRVRVIAGGQERTASVRRALDAAPEAELVLVHDAARAFTPASVITDVADALRAGAPAVVPVLPVTDTVKRIDEHGTVTATIDRSTLRTVQTPQGFSAEVLRSAYEHGGGALTDDAGLVERTSFPVRTVPGHAHAMKITTPFDLAVAENVLTNVGQPAAEKD